MSQYKTLVLSESPSSESEVDWSPTNELLSESLVPTTGRGSIDQGESSNQSANAFPCELLSELPETLTIELGLIVPRLGELPNELRTTQQENNAHSVSPGDSETASGLGELPSESRVTLTEGELPSRSLASTLETVESVEKEAWEQGAGSKGDSSDGDSTPPYRDALSRSGGKRPMFRSAPQQGEGVISPCSLPPSPCLFVDVAATETPETRLPMELLPQIPDSLTGSALARRLGVSAGSISRNKTKDNFGQWTSQHDPDGITWHFDAHTFRRSLE